MDKDKIINALRNANAAIARGRLIDALEFTRYALTEMEDAKIAEHKRVVAALAQQKGIGKGLDIEV